MPPLEISCSHVDVVNVQNSFGSLDVCANAATLLARSPGNIHVSRFQYWPAREYCVSVRTASVVARTTKRRIHIKFLGDGFNLSLMGIADCVDFLKRNNVGLQVGEYVHNSLEAHAAIDA